MSALRSIGSIFFSAAFSFTVLGFHPASVRAEDIASAPEVENSKYQFLGTINTKDVYVRSGPAESYYPTVKLDKGAQVTVVGIRFDWLKVLPPEGSFCYVSKVWVDRRGDGSKGRVTKPDLNVRAGSLLVKSKTTVQTKLNEGDDVEILGEEDEYFKIKPPAGTFVYVNKQFVDPGKALNAPNAPEIVRAAAPAYSGGNTQVADGSTTRPADSTAAVAVPAPATQPANAEAEAEFDQLEADYLAAAKLPLDQQNLAALVDGYTKLSAGGLIPDSMRRMTEYRLRVLQPRLENQKTLAALAKANEEAAKRAEAMKAEQAEIEARIAGNRVLVYTAVGTLRTSSLQVGVGGTLYRLTDPANGRTVIYIRSNDDKLVGMIGQFIGVKGDVVGDATIQGNVVNPTAIEPVDPNKVNTSVAAQVMPASMAPRSSAASAGGN